MSTSAGRFERYMELIHVLDMRHVDAVLHLETLCLPSVSMWRSMTGIGTNSD